MTLYVPNPRPYKIQKNYSGVPGGSMGTNVITGTSAHALGSSFTEVFSATERDTFWVEIMLHGTDASVTDTSTLVNLYSGADGSEILFIDSLAAGFAPALDTGANGKFYCFPLFIPRGTRISAKSRSVQTSKNVRLSIALHGGALPNNWFGVGVETLGANTASSKGTNVTPGDTTRGSWSSIGTTGRNYGYVQPMINGATDTNIVNNAIDADIGTGDAVIPGLEMFQFGSTSTEQLANSSLGRFCNIPSGTPLQMRSAVSNNIDTHDFLIYGVY